jgi:hypothetical protein
MLAGWAMRRETVVVDDRTAATATPATAPVTRMSAPPPFTAARTETEATEEETAVAGNGSTRREVLLVP